MIAGCLRAILKGYSDIDEGKKGEGEGKERGGEREERGEKRGGERGERRFHSGRSNPSAMIAGCLRAILKGFSDIDEGKKRGEEGGERREREREEGGE